LGDSDDPFDFGDLASRSCEEQRPHAEAARAGQVVLRVID
jgi:hypothetical protein